MEGSTTTTGESTFSADERLMADITLVRVTIDERDHPSKL